MAEDEAVKTEEEQRMFAVEKIYLKDMSFETPNSPDVFAMEGEWKPETEIEMNWTSRKLTDVVYESVLSVTITSKIKDKTAYLVEVQQAGLFHIGGFPEADTAALLGTYCPNQLFPFAREAVTNLVSKGGFPHLLLKPVNFEAAYQEQMARAAQAQAEGGDAAQPAGAQ